MEANTQTLQSHCPYCALQCAMNLQVTRRDGEPAENSTARGEEVHVSGASFPTNRGRLCRKGATAAQLLTRSDRLTTPLIREHDDVGERIGQADSAQFREASWDEALDLITTKIQRLQREYGHDALGVFGSGALTNEKTYMLGKFARIGLGTSQIDYNGRWCMSSASKASTMVFGLDRGLPFPLSDLDEAGTILMMGSNVADTMPPFVQHLEGARSQGGLLVIDPRRSNTAELTEDGAGLHIAPTPGGDLILLLSVAQVVLEEGFADLDYLDERTTGLDDFRRSVSHWWPERAQAATGVGADKIRLLARTLGHAAAAARWGDDPVFILTGRGVEQHRDGTDTARAAISLALLLGLPGAGSGDSRRGGYGTLTGQGNGQGGREMGQKSDQLPGFRMISKPADRAHIAEVWGVDEQTIPGPGKPATQLLHTMGRTTGDGEDMGVRGLFVHASNVAVSAPDAARVLENLRALDLLVVSDFFLSETAQEADVVLPVLQWAEEEGTMTSLEGRVLRRRRAIDPPSGARSDLWIIAELAHRLQAPSTWPVEPADVFDEIRQATQGATADYSGIDYQLLDAGHAAYWPAPDGAAATEERSETGEPVLGTSRMFQQEFAHTDGRAHLEAIRPLRQNQPRQAGELTFTTGRLMEHYQSGVQTRRVADLLQTHPEVFVEVHPATARQYGLEDEEYAVIESAQGSMTAKVVVSDAIRADTIFAPFHFAQTGTANLLTRGLTDPHSHMPEYKSTPATIRPAADQQLPQVQEIPA